MTEPPDRLANLAPDLRLAEESSEGLPGGPGQLPEQVANEPLRR
jgi:hypothetical protein